MRGVVWEKACHGLFSFHMLERLFLHICKLEWLKCKQIWVPGRYKYMYIYIHGDLIGLYILTETWQYYPFCVQKGFQLGAGVTLLIFWGRGDRGFLGIYCIVWGLWLNPCTGLIYPFSVLDERSKYPHLQLTVRYNGQSVDHRLSFQHHHTRTEGTKILFVVIG
jgi:hypothetical protein